MDRKTLDKIHARNKVYRKEKGRYGWYERRYSRLKNKAKKRGIPVLLTCKEYIKIREKEKCIYCGRTEDVVFSIDRLDNDGPYSVDNCAVACYECNRIKAKRYTVDQMMMIGRALKRIHKNTP